jgi:hypothetical protein
MLGATGFRCAKPDGAPSQLMDSGRLRNLVLQHNFQLREGLVFAYEAMLAI